MSAIDYYITGMASQHFVLYMIYFSASVYAQNVPYFQCLYDLDISPAGNTAILQVLFELCVLGIDLIYLSCLESASGDWTLTKVKPGEEIAISVVS